MEEKPSSARGRRNVPPPAPSPTEQTGVPTILPSILRAQTVQDLGKRSEFFGYMLGLVIVVAGLVCLIGAIGQEEGLLLGAVGVFGVAVGFSIGLILVTLGRFIQWDSQNPRTP